MKVSVSILSKKDKIKETIEKINNTTADFIHLDVLDNSYIDEYSFSINDFKDINISKKLDVHLMSSNLDERIEEYSSLNPEYITIHYEVGNVDKYINLIKEKNIKVGLAINPETSIDEIKSYLDKIDMLLIMGVHPGKGGQAYITSIDEKIKEAYSLKESYNYLISVDGGINNETIKNIEDYIDIAVSGNYITSSLDYDEKIMSLKKFDTK